MQDIVLTIPFNKEFYLRSQKLAWSLTVKSVSVSYIIYSAVTLLVLGVGITIDSKGGLPLTTLIGVVMLITILLKIRALYIARKAFFAKVNYLADRYAEDEIEQSYTFTNWGLESRDQTRVINLSWPLFEPIAEINNTLIFRLKEDEQIHLMISMEQIGHTIYHEIKAIVTEKTAISD